VSVRIRATGSSVPEGKVTNADLERVLDTTDEWIVGRTGIRERGMLPPGEATSDLATRAAEIALERAQLAVDDIDLIVVGTCTPDMFTPATANLVQRNLRPGRPVPSFDLNAACSGFLYGLQVVGDLVEAGRYRRALLIGAEGLTRFMDYQDRGTCILFGDGAGAVLLERDERPRGEVGLVHSELRSQGEFWDLIQIPGAGARNPASPYVLTQRMQFVRMNGRQTFKLAVQTMEQIARDTLDRSSWKLHDVDHVLVHQANRRIIEAVSERLGLSEERVPINVDRMGNTSAASIPVLLDECDQSGRFQAGDKILLCAFGAGLTWGAATLIWG
jgi:3-oxoacyl-[acyl-carrier-protein] synthase-3